MAKLNDQEVADWRTRYEQFGSSGQSRSKYCKSRGINYHQFTYWFHKFSKTPAQPFSAVVIDKTRALPASLAGSATMRIGRGVKLEFGAGTDPKWLASVINAVEVNS